MNPDMESIGTSYHTPIGVSIHLGLIAQFHYQTLEKIVYHPTVGVTNATNNF